MITKNDIKKTLVDIGIKLGDAVLVHSSLKKVGPIEGGADSIIDAFLEVIGEDGILAMPSFTYTFNVNNPYFDVSYTPGKTGVLTEVFRKREATLRSLNPVHSVLAQGKGAAELLNDHLFRESLGLDSPIDRLALKGGYVFLIGVTHTSNSTIHVGEVHANVKKFYKDNREPEKAKVLLEDKSIFEYPIDTSGSCSRAFNAIELPMRKKRMIIDFDFGDAPSLLMKGGDVILTVLEMVKEQSDILFCNRQSCTRCLLGREYAQSKINSL